jgi:hypothetical protein
VRAGASGHHVVMVVMMVVTVAVVMMMVMTEPTVVMMVVMGPVMVMMMVMILHQRHVRIGRCFLPSSSGLGRIHGPQNGERIRDRREQFGERPRAVQRRRIRALDGCGLGAVERCQAGNRAYQANDFVHLRLLG